MTTGPIQPAFEFDVVMISLDKLMCKEPISEKLKTSVPYRSLLASVRTVGIVEPLIVFSLGDGSYRILDGRVRVAALRDLGMTEAPCLKSIADEEYTPNQKVSQIAPIQATRMMLKAIDKGTAEERIAESLNLAVKTVRGNRLVLQNICPEAVELLKDKPVAHAALRLLKKVKPLRQIEMAELMVASGCYTVTHARGLVMRTPKDQLVDPESPHRIPGVKPEDLARLAHEMQLQEKDFRMLDETYTEQVMALTIARGYLRPLLENNRVVKYLSKNFRELLAEFQRITEASALEG